MELNLHKIEDEHEGNYATVLSYTAVHEAGHYLGLAHSSDTTAVMFERYNPDTQSSPELAPDDIDGICELYPPPQKISIAQNRVTCRPGSTNRRAKKPPRRADEAEQEAARDAAEADSGCSIAAVGQRAHSVWFTAAVLLSGLAVAVRPKRRNSVRRWVCFG